MTAASWRDLLDKPGQTMVLAWLGGRSLRSGGQAWTIEGRLPRQEGWYRFEHRGRRAWVKDPAEAGGDDLQHLCRGYLVGDRLVRDDVRAEPEPAQIASYSETVHLLDRGLDRFVRVVAGRQSDDGPLIYKQIDMPQGTEDAVLTAYLKRETSVSHVPNVAPALDAAFRMESWMRIETERRRAELLEEQRKEAERQVHEARMREMADHTGTSAGRRALAAIDFGAAAKAALAVGGAEYLDHQAGYYPHEMMVTFRFVRRTLVCTCDARTLRIIDAGICLTDHATRVRGDALFSLESLPSVIAEAHRRGVLVVQLRPTNWDGRDDYGGDGEDDDE